MLTNLDLTEDDQSEITRLILAEVFTTSPPAMLEFFRVMVEYDDPAERAAVLYASEHKEAFKVSMVKAVARLPEEMINKLGLTRPNEDVVAALKAGYSDHILNKIKTINPEIGLEIEQVIFNKEFSLATPVFGGRSRRLILAATHLINQEHSIEDNIPNTLADDFLEFAREERPTLAKVFGSFPKPILGRLLIEKLEQGDLV
jgi:hypothetical protein